MESFTSISTQKVTDLTRFSLSVQRFNAFKHHWSDNRVPVLLEVNQGSVDQIDPATNRVLCSYDYKDMEGITHVRQTQLVLSSNRTLNYVFLITVKLENMAHTNLVPLAQLPLSAKINRAPMIFNMY